MYHVGVNTDAILHIAGLGPGNGAAVPPRTLALLRSGLPILVRTARHPTLTVEPLRDLPFTALDEEYEHNRTFDDTYNAIVDRVLRTYHTRGEMVYAVPGHPLIGETTVDRLLARARAEGVYVRLYGAPSFVDACLEALRVAVPGDFQVLDALSLDPSSPAPPDALRAGSPLLLYQVYSTEAASHVKLSLMRVGYPDEFPVQVIQAAGVPGAESVREVPLHALDRTGRGVPPPDHLTSVFVPPLPPSLRQPTFSDLVHVMARLRDPNGGCPWDLKQTHQTLRRYVLEEAYEVAEAIDTDDPDALCEELGDLLLQVVFHAQLAAEEGIFDADDVCRAIVEKLIRRHPHVFGEVKVNDAEQVLANWNAIKATEKAEQGKSAHTSILDGISQSLPALMMALETSKRAVKAGFEWSSVDGVLDKIEEELAELRQEIEAGASAERVASELGDVLFTLVNLGRKFEVDAETALRAQIARFHRRFRHIESRAAGENRALESLSLDEMEQFWQEAKQHEKQERK
ncbi:MAG: nucleoside triphosphate pyrophosphohydrolase [Armatimonadaceae bacterium]